MNTEKASYMRVERIITQAKRFADSGHIGEAIARARFALKTLADQTETEWGEEPDSLTLSVQEMLESWLAEYEESRQTLEDKRLDKMRNPEREAEKSLPPL